MVAGGPGRWSGTVRSRVRVGVWMSTKVRLPLQARPWGAFTVLDAGDRYQVKRIEVRVGRRLSYQRHRLRSEHWVVASGTADVVLDGTSSRLLPGDSIDIPLGAAHRLGNGGDDLLVVIEVQWGSYVGDDDIERLEDDFGRSSPA